MWATYVVVTLLVAATMGYAGSVDLARAGWVLDNMSRLGVPHTWLFALGALKLAGAAGLVVGLAVPAVGVAAAVGLVLFFVGAIVTVVRARWYAHWYPVLFLAFAAAALAVRVATL